MKEFYPEIMEKYMPEIEPHLAGEKVVHRFVATWVGLGARLSGLCVVSDEKIYFRGKVKMSGRSSTFSLISSGSKSKEVHMIPLNAIEQLTQKKNKFIIRENLSWMGGKYEKKNKKTKIVIEMSKGKGPDGKESKEELIARANELKEYIDSKRSP
ncbi:MAG: hypothetical protein EU549_00815 [Promethearchaeota archaeon]|nr:MAG: hypothetical protein EU549_00815 [Candidatus Lokiarchaeota archaeon]